MHNACMATNITVRKVPDRVRNELAARAARAGQSMQEYLLAELERLTRRPTVPDWLARVRERKESGRGRLTRREILAFRDADRA